jgi:hypothetical protein
MPLNLTAARHGLYSYPVAMPSVSFVASLSDQGGWSDGTIEEVGSVGDASAHYDSVHCGGDLNQDETEIAGTWRLASNWSGTFLMLRSRTAETSATKEAVARR